MNKKKPVTKPNPGQGTIVYKCFFDGSCEPDNPGGNMGIGALIVCSGEDCDQYSAFVPAARSNTNNVAEYMAFIWIIDWLMKELQGYTTTPGFRPDVTIYGDSKLVINQMFGSWGIKAGYYVPYAIKAKDKLRQLKTLFPVKGLWIPRKKNNRADDLSKQQLIEHGIEFKLQPSE